MIKINETHLVLSKNYLIIPESYSEFEKEFKDKAVNLGNGFISVESLRRVQHNLDNYLINLFSLGVITKHAEVTTRHPLTHPKTYAEAVGLARSITCDKSSVTINYQKRSVSYTDYDFEIEKAYTKTIQYHTLSDPNTIEITIYSGEQELSLKDLWYAGKSIPNE